MESLGTRGRNLNIAIVIRKHEFVRPPAGGIQFMVAGPQKCVDAKLELVRILHSPCLEVTDLAEVFREREQVNKTMPSQFGHANFHLHVVAVVNLRACLSLRLNRCADRPADAHCRANARHLPLDS